MIGKRLIKKSPYRDSSREFLFTLSFFDRLRLFTQDMPDFIPIFYFFFSLFKSVGLCDKFKENWFFHFVAI